MSFFVPRSGRLNSDVISVALNEILVIPPHEDVMEEMIEAVGNISFVQGNESSLSRRPHSRGPSPRPRRTAAIRGMAFAGKARHFHVPRKPGGHYAAFRSYALLVLRGSARSGGWE
jgi:hypothetical protein